MRRLRTKQAHLAGASMRAAVPPVRLLLPVLACGAALASLGQDRPAPQRLRSG